MKTLIHWFDQRTGLLSMLGNWFQRPMAGGPAWRFVWPTTIAFTLVVQAITGLVLWMYYSAGAQSAWESVYYLQYQVLGGWLLRAIHYYTGQAMLVLIGIYFLQMVFRGAYRAPREFLFWTVLAMGLATLGLNLTGDVLSWDQNSYWATGIRVSYLSQTPVVGPWLAKLVVGGPQFGTFTITRFLALHVGVCTAALLGLAWLHGHQALRHGLEASSLPGRTRPDRRGAGGEGLSMACSVSGSSAPYWPRQAWRDATACFIVMAIIVGLSARHGVAGPQAGIELGAPADPVADPGTARPEWSFRGLYQLHETLGAWPEIISIMVIPGLTVLLFFAMPLIGKSLACRALNIVLVLLVFGGVGVLSWRSYSEDATNEKYQAALQEGRRQARWVKELAASPRKIPVSGALTLLHTALSADAKTQGPRIFNQHCASCHDYSGATIVGINRPETPTAADLYGYAGRPWLTEFLTVKGISSPKYFGNTKFKKGAMYGFIKDTFFGEDMSPEDRRRIIQALSAQAALKSQREADSNDAAEIKAGGDLIGKNCTDCHTFHGKGESNGPDLAGYGSRDWIIGLVGNPAHKRFYGRENDRMPAFAESATDPKQNILSRQDLELLADWLRGEWYEPETK